MCEAYLLPNSILESKKKQQLNNKNDRNYDMSTKANFSTPFDPQSLNKGKSQDQNQNEDELNSFSECLVVSMFFNPESGLLVYDSYPRGEIYSKLISVRIPYHFFVTKVDHIVI